MITKKIMLKNFLVKIILHQLKERMVMYFKPHTSVILIFHSKLFLQDEEVIYVYYVNIKNQRLVIFFGRANIFILRADIIRSNIKVRS